MRWRERDFLRQAEDQHPAVAGEVQVALFARIDIEKAAPGHVTWRRKGLRHTLP
jgi:hypothetical protein